MEQRLFKKDLQVPVEAIIQEIVPAMIETVIENMTPHFIAHEHTAMIRIIETTVLKGQIEMLDYILNNEFSTELTYLTSIRNKLVQQLDHAATTEVHDEL